MNREIRILFIDDSQDDVDLAGFELKRHGIACEAHRVATGVDLELALAQQDWDLILCDCRIPGLETREAWAMCAARQTDTPFAVLAGLVFNEQTIALLDAGVRYFFDKNRMHLLAPGVRKLVTENVTSGPGAAQRKAFIKRH